MPRSLKHRASGPERYLHDQVSRESNFAGKSCRRYEGLRGKGGGWKLLLSDGHVAALG
jgi:hypothetical protein